MSWQLEPTEDQTPGGLFSNLLESVTGTSMTPTTRSTSTERSAEAPSSRTGLRLCVQPSGWAGSVLRSPSIRAMSPDLPGSSFVYPGGPRCGQVRSPAVWDGGAAEGPVCRSCWWVDSQSGSPEEGSKTLLAALSVLVV